MIAKYLLSRNCIFFSDFIFFFRSIVPNIEAGLQDGLWWIDYKTLV